MSPILIAVLAALLALVVALFGTWYGWRDYRRHPDRYGYRPGERQRRFAKPDRGVTHQAARRWSTSTRHASPRVRVP